MAHCPNGPVFSLACGRRSAVIFIGGMSISVFEALVHSRRPDRFREGYLVNVNLWVRYPGEVTDTSYLDTFSPMATRERCYTNVIHASLENETFMEYSRVDSRGMVLIDSSFSSAGNRSAQMREIPSRCAFYGIICDLIISSSKPTNRLSSARSSFRRLHESTRITDSP